MQKKKEIFLGMIKRNFNNELEHLLEHKEFSEDVKNILLSMLYKLETAYNDYEQVKKSVMPKEDFLQTILDTIEKDINSIELIKIGTTEAKKTLKENSFYIDKENKRIVCYPIETKLLYAICKIAKKDKIVKNHYFLLNETISNLLNIGNNINSVEPMRDFNGFSWSIVAKDIESIEYNIIYQDIRILIGDEFLNNWVQNKEEIIDYLYLFKTKLEEKYGEEIQNKLADTISTLSIFLQIKNNEDTARKIIILKNKIERNKREIDDIDKFTVKLTREKKKINKQIKELDTTRSDKNLLQAEYLKRNGELPLERKIFSVKVLAQILKEERQALFDKKRKINKMLNPQEFLKYRESLEERYKYVKYVDLEQNDKNIKNELINLQETFLEAFNIRIQNAKEKKEVLDLIIEFRYYLNIPINKTKKIADIPQIWSFIEQIKKTLISKALEMKLIIRVLKQEEANYKLLQEIFNTKIINLEGINIELTKENDIIAFQIFDENVFEKRIELQNIITKDIEIKLNKMLNAFNI